jgi:general secretion pathway protein A
MPLFYNKQCLVCHGSTKGEVDISGYEKEGFKDGDLGGTISITLPFQRKIRKIAKGNE